MAKGSEREQKPASGGVRDYKHGELSLIHILVDQRGPKGSALSGDCGRRAEGSKGDSDDNSEGYPYVGGEAGGELAAIGGDNPDDKEQDDCGGAKREGQKEAPAGPVATSPGAVHADECEKKECEIGCVLEVTVESWGSRSVRACDDETGGR